jgi:hypothetical protein
MLKKALIQLTRLDLETAFHAAYSSAMTRPIKLSAVSGTTAFARTSDFLERNQHGSTCPVAESKIFLFPSDPNHRLMSRHPVPYEGRFAIVTDVGRDAVDADALVTNSA